MRTDIMLPSSFVNVFTVKLPRRQIW